MHNTRPPQKEIRGPLAIHIKGHAKNRGVSIEIVSDDVIEQFANPHQSVLAIQTQLRHIGSVHQKRGLNMRYNDWMVLHNILLAAVSKKG